MYHLASEAHSNNISLHRTEIAKAEVNLAAVLITQRRYGEAMHAASRARDADSTLITPHIAILAIHVRRRSQEELEDYVRHLLASEPWIFNNEDFKERLKNDPDLVGVANIIITQKERKP